MASLLKKFKGRGASSNRSSRYNELSITPYDDGWSVGSESVTKTTVEEDHSKTLINQIASPDLPFKRSINMYRGCEHGCIYCYARPTHSYLGYSAGLDFETKLLAKVNAAELLKKELSHPGYDCKPIAFGTNTDPYQPIERDYNLTTQLLEVLLEHRHPVSITTKSYRIVSDIDILAELAKMNLVSAAVSVTTLDSKLCQLMEPRCSAPHRRIEAIRKLSEAGVPTTVMFAPVIPGLNEHEMETILSECRDAGAEYANWILLRLPKEVKGLFYQWLQEHYPLKFNRVRSLVRQSRKGAGDDSAFFRRFTGSGAIPELIESRFRSAVKKFEYQEGLPSLNTKLFRGSPEALRQTSLF